jgi:hypothetical protein
MNIREISKPVTAASLNESLARKFGSKIALEKFTLEQLQDVRNKIRTTLSQVETNESFNVVQSESYQKNKLFLDVLNAEISEREDVAENKTKVSDCDKTCPKSCPDCGGTGNPEKYKKDKKDMKEAAKPDKNKNGIPDYAEDGKGPNDLKKKKKAPQKESIVREGAEDQAEIVMAAKDMVNRVTSWMEDTAEMQTESMLELADAIRDEQGQEKSDAFVQTVKPALESLYTAMESTRESLTAGVGQLTGEAAPVTDMGAEPEEPDMEPTVDADAAAGGEDLDVSLDAAPAGAGGEAEAGREKRESRMHKRKMLETSRRLGTILSKKK